jgi:hypothetical protein
LASFVLLLTPDGTPAGMAEWRDHDRYLFLNQLFVAPSYHQRGGARYLLAQRLSEVGDSCPTGHLQLDVFESNHRAHAWYARLGFQPLENKTWYVVPPPRLPEADTTADIHGLDQAEHQHKRYGFSHITVSTPSGTYPVGRLGSDLFRIDDLSVLENKSALHALATLDPHRALLYVGPGSPSMPGTCLARSVRMEAPISTVRQALLAASTVSSS